MYLKNQSFNPLSERYKLLFLVVSFTIVNVIISLKQGVWLDEVYTLTTTSQNLKQVFNTSLKIEMQAPLYFIALSIWRWVSLSFFWARLFSILIAAFSIIFFHRLLNLFFSTKKALLYSLIFAFNPYTIWAAQEIRVYSTAILLLIYQHYLFFKLYFQAEDIQRRHRIGFIIVSIICTYTNYFLIFPLIINFLILLTSGMYKMARIYLIDMIWPVISALLLTPFLIEQYSYHYHDEYSIHNPILILKELIYRIDRYLSSFTFFPKYVRISFRLIFYGFITIVLIKAKNELFKSKNRFIFLYLIFLSFITFGLYFILSADILYARHTYYLYPIVLICFCLIMNAVPNKLSNIIVYGLIVCYLSINFINYSKNRKSETLIDIAKYIENKSAKKQNVIIYLSIYGNIFNEFYKGKNKIIPLPRAMNYEKKIDLMDYVVNKEAEIEQFINENKFSDTIWLITGDKEKLSSKIKPSYLVLDKYFSKYHKIISDTVFSEEFKLREIVLIKKE